MSYFDCQPLLKKRQACYKKHKIPYEEDSLYQKGASRTSGATKACLPHTLAAKRCLAFQNCELEALHYYGTPSDELGPKALCASYDEIYCFGNPGVMKVDSDRQQEKDKVFAHHQKAKRRIINSRQKLKACETVSYRMHQCLKRQGENQPQGEN